MPDKSRPLAVVTGASTGIGNELAKCCAREGFDLVVVADEPEIKKAAADFEALGVKVDALQADLATLEGVDELYELIGGRSCGATRQRGQGPRQGLSRPGLQGRAAGRQYQRHRHHLSHP
jgi:NAD(P)-dependent dehydrogenase (short-subunit alcohol dehydrogenase family)